MRSGSFFFGIFRNNLEGGLSKFHTKTRETPIFSQAKPQDSWFILGPSAESSHVPEAYSLARSARRPQIPRRKADVRRDADCRGISVGNLHARVKGKQREESPCELYACNRRKVPASYIRVTLCQRDCASHQLSQGQAWEKCYAHPGVFWGCLVAPGGGGDVHIAKIGQTHLPRQSALTIFHPLWD